MTQANDDIAIRVEHLGKLYRIGQTGGYKTLRESMMGWFGPRAEKPAASSSDFWALKDVNFEVKRGEVVGIIGRNGAGKSTLLKVLSRITEPTEGRVEITGRVGSLLEVGTGFHPELTGRENVFLNGAILGMREGEIRKKFDEIVAFAEIEQFIDTPVKRYSSGMYTRLAFAVAAHLEPEILIVDEVLAVGDQQFQSKCMGKMKDVAGQGRTVLFVSHNMSAIAQLCSSAILLRSGQVQTLGPTASVLGDYVSDASEGTDGTYDLRGHPARPRAAREIIVRAQLSSADGVPTHSFFPDSRWCVELDLVGDVDDPMVAVAIEDHSGRRITTMASYFSPGELPAIRGTTTVRCVKHRLDLAPGRYLLSVSVSDRHGGQLDSIDNCGWFEVEWNNTFGNGQPYGSVYGPVMSQSSWGVVDDVAV